MQLRSLARTALCLIVLAGCKSAPEPKPAQALAAPKPTGSAFPSGFSPGRSQTTGPAAGSDSVAANNPPTAGDKAAEVERALREMSKIRNLPIKRPVGGIVLDRASMIAKIRAHVDKEVPRVAIVREGQAMQLLGVLPESFDYAEETFAMLKEQLAGFYEPEDGNMYLANDLEGDAANVTLSHELVHALQDQSFNLKAQSTYKPGEADIAFARSALAEGDATSAMFEPLLAPQGLDLLKLPDSMIETLMAQNETTNPAHQLPPIMQAGLIAPYTVGLLFVNQLRRRGGWDAVTAAWANPPKTSEQLLHLSKYDAHEPAANVPAPTARALTGYQLVDADSQGELGLRLLFAEWLSDLGEAKTLAADWGGDRTGFFERGKERALSIRVVLDPGARVVPGAARMARIASALDTKLAGIASHTPGYICIDRPHLGPLSVRGTATGYVITAGPATAGATPASGWTTTMNCANPAIARWSAELAAP